METEDKPEELPIDPPEADDEPESPEGPEAKEGPRETAKERKQRRPAMKRQLEEANERAARLERALQEERAARERDLHEARMAQLRAQQGPQPEQKREDPIAALRREEEVMLDSFRNLGAEEQQAKYGEFREKMAEIEERKFQARLKAYQAQQPQQQFDPRQVMLMMQQQMNPDVYGDPEKRRWAAATYHKYLVEKEQDGPALHDRVMEETREYFGLPTRNQAHTPSQQQRKRHSSVASGPSSGGGEAPRTINIKGDPVLRAAADAWGDHIADEDERYRQYALKVGPRLVSRKAG